MRQGEFGGVLYVATNVDLTTATNLSLVLSRPHEVLTLTITDGVAVGAVDLVVGDITYLAGFYVTYTIQEGDIKQAGQYKARIEATIGTIHYVSSTGCFTVDKQAAACPCP